MGSTQCGDHLVIKGVGAGGINLGNGLVSVK
jgi:hypothetical protein